MRGPSLGGRPCSAALRSRAQQDRAREGGAGRRSSTTREGHLELQVHRGLAGQRGMSSERPDIYQSPREGEVSAAVGIKGN